MLSSLSSFCSFFFFFLHADKLFTFLPLSCGCLLNLHANGGGEKAIFFFCFCVRHRNGFLKNTGRRRRPPPPLPHFSISALSSAPAALSRHAAATQHRLAKPEVQTDQARVGRVGLCCTNTRLVFFFFLKLMSIMCVAFTPTYPETLQERSSANQEVRLVAVSLPFAGSAA